MNEPFALAAFLARWNEAVRHDLSASDSETLSLAALLALAEPDDISRWEALGFGYAHPRGASWLRAAIATRHTGLDADDVLCCAGAQEAVTCVARALLGPADHAVVVLPIYQPSEQSVTSLCPATGVPLNPEDGWQLDVDRVAAAIRPNTKLILTNFPNSPTGAAMDGATLSALVALCRTHGLWLVNDEVYRQTDGGADTLPMVADVYERGVSINGLSKGFGLPGLRVGWAACRDPEILARTLCAKSMLSSCVASASEVLAHVAIRAERAITERTRAIGARNRRRLQDLIDGAPHVFEAAGMGNLAFAFPRYLGLEGADRFAARMVREAGLLVLPSCLWQSPLAPVPSNHLRVGLGHAKHASGIEALACFVGAQGAASRQGLARVG